MGRVSGGSKGKGSSYHHATVVREIMLQSQAAFGDRLFIMKQHSGLFQPLETGGQQCRKQLIRIGIPGMSDIGGWLKNSPASRRPCPFQVEVKTGNASLNSEQQRWRTFCERMGVPWHLLRYDPETGKPGLKAVILETLEWMSTLTDSSLQMSSLPLRLPTSRTADLRLESLSRRESEDASTMR